MLTHELVELSGLVVGRSNHTRTYRPKSHVFVLVIRRGVNHIDLLFIASHRLGRAYGRFSFESSGRRVGHGGLLHHRKWFVEVRSPTPTAKPWRAKHLAKRVLQFGSWCLCRWGFLAAITGLLTPDHRVTLCNFFIFSIRLLINVLVLVLVLLVIRNHWETLVSILCNVSYWFRSPTQKILFVSSVWLCGSLDSHTLSFGHDLALDENKLFVGAPKADKHGNLFICSFDGKSSQLQNKNCQKMRGTYFKNSKYLQTS